MVKISLEKAEAYNKLYAEMQAKIAKIRAEYNEKFKELHLLSEAKK